MITQHGYAATVSLLIGQKLKEKRKQVGPVGQKSYNFFPVSKEHRGLDLGEFSTFF